jgi:Asp-tRNA(Asn)/Glu-tRNA(Gln) amidotransferase A subunit family amidase
MDHTIAPSQGRPAAKNLTVSQQQWLAGVIASMKDKINTELEPNHDARAPLEKVLADDCAPKHMHHWYDGVMQLGSSQMPNFHALWVARRAELGRG